MPRGKGDYVPSREETLAASREYDPGSASIPVGSTAAPDEVPRGDAQESPEGVAPAPGDAPPAGGGERADLDAGALAFPELTLEESIRLSLERSRGIDIADRQILIAADRVDEMYTYLGPRLRAEGRMEARTNNTGGQFGDQSFVIGDQAKGGATISMLVPIYTFGLVQSRIGAETSRWETSRHDADRARQDLILAVSQAYVRMLEARKILEVVEDSIKVVRRQLTIAQDFFGQGLVARTDVLSAEVQLANREQQRIQAENNIQLARATFNRLLEFDVSRPTRVVDILETRPWVGAFEPALAEAVRRRPDLKALRSEVETAREEWNVTLADGHAPYVYGFGDYSFSTDSYLLNDDWFQYGMILSVPIFDGFQTYTKLQQRDKEIADAIDRYERRFDYLALEVKHAYLNVNEAARSVPVARQSIVQAEENLRMTRDQYSEGWVTSTDVLTEEERRSRARSNYYQALYAYHVAYANLVHAVGGKPPGKPDTRPGKAADTRPGGDAKSPPSGVGIRRCITIGSS